MIKVFHLGSCRTTLQCFNDETFCFVKNYDFTHTTKEVLMYLDFFDGIKNPREVPHLNCLMYFPESFDAAESRKMMDEADVVFVEISSTKIFKFDQHYYSLKMVEKHDEFDVIAEYRQPDAEFAADLLEIRKRINKPVVFTGHIDLDFHDIPGLDGHIDERSHIDNIIQSHCDNHIIIKDLFSGLDYKEVMKENDTHHITNSSKEHILRALKEKCALL